MTAAATCANCKAPLPDDQAAGNAYCASCTAAWTKGNDATDAAGTAQCANCKASLPADQPADNAYCASCTATWTGS